MITKPEWERLAWALMDQNWSEHDWKAATELRRLGLENAKQAEQLKALTHLVTQLHQAKGRYHTQQAAARLYELAGLPSTKPENNPAGEGPAKKP